MIHRVLTFFSIWTCGLPLIAIADDRPNVVIVLADDLGYSDLGCYGGEIDTPNLDRLAAQGLRFSQFYNTARCWPSRAALLTGYYAQQVRRDTVPGVRSGGNGVRPAWAKLLPEMLRKQGYRNYHSGKWHVDGLRLANGFDRSYSLEDHDHYFAPRHHLEDDKPLPPATAPYYATTAIADFAIRCLNEHAQRPEPAPFFLYVAFTAPHFPLQAPESDIAKYRERYRSGWQTHRVARFERQQTFQLTNTTLSAPERELGPPYRFPDAFQKLGPGEVDTARDWNDLTPEQREFQANKMAVHAAMVDRLDREVGRVIEQLKQLEKLDNTLLLFLSDNGASAEIMGRGDGHSQQAPVGSAETFLCLGPGWSNVANTPFRRHKTWVHEGGISTPCLMHWPRGIAARGELRHAPAHLIDIVPTLLQLAGATPPSAEQPLLPGRSLVPLFAADNALPPPTLWWEHEGNRALRVADWKIVCATDRDSQASKADASWELYNLTTDRAESLNLAATQPDRVQVMAETWRQMATEFYANATKTP